MDDDTKELRKRPSLGILIGKYKILEILGKGGMGTVYRAHDTNLDRPVALKVLTGHADDDHAVARFIREARTAARLQHPNIVAVYDFGEVGKIHFIATELIEGKSLDKLIYEHITPRRGLNIIRKSALALHHAHTNGVLHRDVKPSNILIGLQDEPHIADFGLAKHAFDSKLTISGTVVGTPSYISPEQGEGKAIDGRTDLYALGATLYHILTGTPPFEGFSALDILRKAVSEDPISPRSVNPEIPKDVETIIMKCMEKNPKKRYENCLELAKDIERYLNDELITARPVSIIEKGFRKVGRNPWAYGGLAAAVLAFAIGAPIVLTSLKSAELQRQKTAQIENEREKEKKAKEENDRKRREAWPLYQHAEQEFKDAEDALKRGEYAEYENLRAKTRNTLETILAQHELPEALYLHTKILRKTGEYEKAIQELDRVIELNNDNFLALFDRGLNRIYLLLDRQQADESIKNLIKSDFWRLRELAQNNKDQQLKTEDKIVFGEALLAHLEKDYKQSIGLLRQTLDSNKYSVEAYFFLGSAYMETKNYNGAVEAFSQAVNYNPGDWRAFGNRGTVFLILNDCKKALEDYSNSINIKKHPQILHSRGVLYAAVEKYNIELSESERLERALRDYNEALNLDPRFTNALISRGILKRKKGDTPGAISDYSAAIEIKVSPLAYYNRANCHYSLRDFKSAGEDYNKCLSLDPTHCSAYMNLGGLLFDQGKPEEAVEIFKKALPYANESQKNNIQAILKKIKEREY